MSERRRVLVVDFVCPFCGKQCAAESGLEQAVTHALPMCAKFESLEPDAFIAAVNVAIATKRGVGIS